jgi:hypothetical protein
MTRYWWFDFNLSRRDFHPLNYTTLLSRTGSP